ncbi:MAG TPA: FtsQ-type POTRA domain-containing protein, partial [Candidatus Saccharimonadales bacterium]|nr:FtsQ-type POTRA domain-containing protein [Candidatus Saccharimonadales bacterium]
LSRCKLKVIMRVVVIAAVGLAVWRFFGIRTIDISGNRQLSAEHIRRAAEESFARHPLSRNLLTLGMAPLESDLQQAEYRLKEVAVKRRWPNGLVIEVAERQTALAWKSGNQLFVIGSDGTAIASADQQAKLPIVTDRANLPVKVGDKVAPARFVAFCLELLEQLPRRTGLQVTSLQVPESTSELHAITNKGYLIKLDTTRGVGDEVTDLVNVLAALTKLGKTPREYIDLRVEHKAYYR